MSKEIKFEKLTKFRLDSQNPRLGRNAHKKRLSQEQILELMQDWSLEEIARSFLENGFWHHEAILCIEEDNYLVVVEGNRRLAALINLYNASKGKPGNNKWGNILKEAKIPKDLFNKIPYIKLDDREEADDVLGFKHVTGIKEWKPAEKAEYITHLINNRNMSYPDVMRKIGSKTDTVRRNYITYSLLLQMEQTEEIDISKVERRFSVMFLSLNRLPVQKFLGININAEPDEAKTPVDNEHIECLRQYARWLFGDEENEAIVKDSRQVDKFAKVLSSEEGLSYLRKAKKPNLENAFIRAGGVQSEIVELLEAAAYNLSNALSYIHRYKKNKDVQKAVKLLLEDAEQLRNIFPED